MKLKIFFCGLIMLFLCANMYVNAENSNVIYLIGNSDECQMIKIQNEINELNISALIQQKIDIQTQIDLYYQMGVGNINQYVNEIIRLNLSLINLNLQLDLDPYGSRYRDLFKTKSYNTLLFNLYDEYLDYITLCAQQQYYIAHAAQLEDELRIEDYKLGKGYSKQIDVEQLKNEFNTTITNISQTDKAIATESLRLSSIMNNNIPSFVRMEYSIADRNTYIKNFINCSASVKSKEISVGAYENHITNLLKNNYSEQDAIYAKALKQCELARLDHRKTAADARKYASVLYDSYEVNKHRYQDLVLKANYFRLKETALSSSLTHGMIRVVDYKAFESEKAKYELDLLESEVNLEKSSFALHYYIEQYN